MSMLKLSIFTFVMVVGQLTFKRVAQSLDGISGIGAILRHLALNPWFLAALMLYGGATLLWIMVLRETPLSKAYMFVALAFALVPLGASVLFHESLGQRYYLGLCLVIAGVGVISSSNVTGANPREIVRATR